jgi:hypothetical protein
VSLAVEIKRMVFELNYILVSNNIEIGGGCLSQIYFGRLSENIGKIEQRFWLFLQ